MALIECRFFSEVLGLETSMNVILPEDKSIDKKMPALFLFHGLSDGESAWVRNTSIERYANKYDVAIIMPRVDRSFYNDMAYGLNYWTFISEELPMIARNLFPISHTREENYVAGLSMGGFGALKLGLSTNHYSYIASLSGVVDVKSMVREGLLNKEEFKNIFGNKVTTDNDLYYLINKVDNSKNEKPRIFMYCGKSDFLYQDNKKFYDFCKKTSFHVTYTEDIGSHNWEYWDEKIKDVLDRLPIRKT